MKSVTYWYQFFTAREELVPIRHGVKFTKCEICGSTKLLFYCTCMLNSNETQRAGKTNKGHRFAAKKNVSIVLIRF